MRYAIAGVCLFKVILFAALSKFCEMAAMTICAWVLATPKYRARCNPKSRFIVPKHCSTRKRCLEISLLKRFCDWRSERPRTALCRIPSRCLPFRAARFALLAQAWPREHVERCFLQSWFQTVGSQQHEQAWYGFYPQTLLHRIWQNPCNPTYSYGPS